VFPFFVGSQALSSGFDISGANVQALRILISFVPPTRRQSSSSRLEVQFPALT